MPESPTPTVRRAIPKRKVVEAVLPPPLVDVTRYERRLIMSFQGTTFEEAWLTFSEDCAFLVMKAIEEGEQMAFLAQVAKVVNERWPVSQEGSELDVKERTKQRIERLKLQILFSAQERQYIKPPRFPHWAMMEELRGLKWEFHMFPLRAKFLRARADARLRKVETDGAPKAIQDMLAREKERVYQIAYDLDRRVAGLPYVRYGDMTRAIPISSLQPKNNTKPCSPNAL
ncbi:hypothetical protein FA15DRAFT_710679 [Coprinopsis marcescibilis]|uniref:Uncharacterized protein n=1 Tax=Coprinopsis marcescibilis TaxID=230819 RepID=A0A5C3KCC3_COPMA|nr:hypothetical protein FA15DRAFT_710679 [Coprinopsis marcescibilis]